MTVRVEVAVERSGGQRTRNRDLAFGISGNGGDLLLKTGPGKREKREKEN